MVEQSLLEPGLLKAVEKYVGSVKETETYKKYYDYRELLRKDPEKYQRVKEFRLKNFEIQNTANENELFDMLVELEKESEELEADPLINRYMHAELAFCRMIQAVSTLITEKLDFE